MIFKKWSGSIAAHSFLSMSLILPIYYWCSQFKDIFKKRVTLSSEVSDFTQMSGFLASNTYFLYLHFYVVRTLPVWYLLLCLFFRKASHCTSDAHPKWTCEIHSTPDSPSSRTKRWCGLTLLGCGHCSNSAWWPMSAWVWCNTGASIIVTVRCHGKWQSLKVSADLLCQISAQVRSITMGLSFSICKWAGAKIGSSFCVLEKANKRFRII